MRKYKFIIILIQILILAGCKTGNEVASSNGNSIIPAPTKIQTQAITEQQETEQIKTPTLETTATPIPIVTNIGEGNVDAVENRFGEMMAVAVEFPDQAIVVFDFKSGESRRLRDDGGYVFIDWVDKGCGLIIGDTIFDSGSIYIIDLHGNFLEEITNYDFQYLEGYLGLGVSDIYLSASGEHVAYIVSAYEDSGLRDPNLFNLYVSRVDDPTSTIALSQNDGVFDLAWSLDGSFIAFSDYDDSGILQLFVSEPEKAEKHQLTNFSLPKSTIQYLSWSPDHEYIAFNYVVRKEEGGILENSIVVVSVQDSKQQIKTFNSIEGKEVKRIQNIWWEDNSVIVVDVIHPSSGKYSSSIYWFNSQSDIVVDKVLQEDVGSLSGPWSKAILSDSYLGLLVQPEFWIFDLEKREVIAKTQMPVDLASSWYLAPLDFPGEAYCK